MASQGSASRIEYARLAQYLAALSTPVRLQLLHKLQVPHASSDIQLTPLRPDERLNPKRAMSRQAVEGHLRRLEAAGLVRTREAERSGRTVTEYYVDHARLFTAVEELRRLSLIRPASGVAPDVTRGASMTVAGGGDMGVALPPGPALVIVGGPMEGHASALAGPGPWHVGRRRDNEVSLRYDPFVSGRNAVVRRDGDDFTVADVGPSKHGTRVNWRRLRPDEEAPLAPGDTFGVGRSLMVFRGV